MEIFEIFLKRNLILKSNQVIISLTFINCCAFTVHESKRRVSYNGKFKRHAMYAIKSKKSINIEQKYLLTKFLYLHHTFSCPGVLCNCHFFLYVWNTITVHYLINIRSNFYGEKISVTSIYCQTIFCLLINPMPTIFKLKILLFQRINDL